MAPMRLPEEATAPPVAVVIPVKAFSRAKRRLAPALGPEARSDLARTMATQVVTAAAPLPVVVVCDDADVAAWAGQLGAEVSWTPDLGLNGAVTATVATLAERGVARVVVAHADLPLARTFTGVLVGTGAVLVPDRHDDGTNVIAVPADAGFRFAYGAGSFRRHLAEAGRLGLAVEVVRLPELMWDVDLPVDLVLPCT